MKQDYRVRELQSLTQVGPPLLMLDRALVDAAAGAAEGVKAISVNEDFFNGHFPGNPIMPGVLQIAAMGQLGCALYKSLRPALREHSVQILRIERIKFRKPVGPGDLLRVSARVKSEEQGGFTVAVETRTDGDLACQGLLTLQAFNPEELQALDRELAPAPRKWDGIEFSAEDIHPVQEIAEVIPHRYPFLLLDRVLHLDHPRSRVIALKNMTGNEHFFRALAVPVVPLYLLAEMAAQAGCFLALREPANQGKIGYFMAIDQALSMAPVNVGDQLHFDTRITSKGRFGKGESDLFVGDRQVARVAVKFAMVDA